MSKIAKKLFISKGFFDTKKCPYGNTNFPYVMLPFVNALDDFDVTLISVVIYPENKFIKMTKMNGNFVSGVIDIDVYNIDSPFVT